MSEPEQPYIEYEGRRVPLLPPTPQLRLLPPPSFNYTEKARFESYDHEQQQSIRELEDILNAQENTPPAYEEKKQTKSGSRQAWKQIVAWALSFIAGVVGFDAYQKIRAPNLGAPQYSLQPLEQRITYAPLPKNETEKYDVQSSIDWGTVSLLFKKTDTPPWITYAPEKPKKREQSTLPSVALRVVAPENGTKFGICYETKKPGVYFFKFTQSHGKFESGKLYPLRTRNGQWYVEKRIQGGDIVKPVDCFSWEEFQPADSIDTFADKVHPHTKDPLKPYLY